MRYIVASILFISSLSATAQIDLRQLIPDSTQYMIPVTDSLIASEYYQKYRQLANTIFIKDDSICYQLLVDGDTTCAPIDTIQVIYGDPTDTSYYFQVQVNGGTIDSITHMELIQINNGTGINVTYNGTAITIASTVTDTDTYIDSVRQIQANNLDSIWLYRNDLSDSLLIVLDDSVGAGSDTYIDSIRHVNDGVLDSIWFYRSDMSDSLLLVLNDSVGAGGGGSDTYIDSVRQVVVGSLDSIWLYRSDLSDSLLIVLNDSIPVLPKSRFVFTDPVTGELTTNGTWSDSVLLYNGGTRYGQIDDKGNVSWGWLAAGSGNNNTRIGGRSGYRNQGDHNTYLGFQSGYLSSSDTHLRNTSIGYESSIDAAGDDNTYIGSQSGRYNISDYSVYIGAESGYMTVVPSGSSDNNLAMGYQSARDAEGDNNVYLGNQAGLSTEGSNNIFIGSISTLTGSVSNRLAIGGASDYFIDGDMSTDSLTVNSTLTVRDVPASSDPDSVYVLGPGHELNSYPISSISGIDTYIDSAAYNNDNDTLRLFRDSSGTWIDSLAVFIPTDTQHIRQFIDSGYYWLTQSTDTVTVPYPWKRLFFEDYNFDRDLGDVIYRYNDVFIGDKGPSNGARLRVSDSNTLSTIADFDNTTGVGGTIDLSNDDWRWRLGSVNFNPTFSIIHSTNTAQNVMTIDTFGQVEWVVYEPGTFDGTPERFLALDVNERMITVHPDSLGVNIYVDSVRQIVDYQIDSIWLLTNDLSDSTLIVTHDSIGKDFDFILLPLNDTLGTNIDSLNPDDSTDLYALIWHGGQVRIGETPYQIRYDTTQGGVDATAALQIVGQNDAIDIYHDSLPTIWIRNNKGDAHIRYSDNEMEHDTTPSFLEFGFINWQDTATMGTMGDTTLRHPFRVSSHANTGALEVYQDSILLGDYVEADTTITSTDLLGSGIFISKDNGKLRLVTPDTLNALLNVVASAPQEIDTFALNNDSLVLDLTNTTEGLKYVDFSNYNNSNITISNDSLFVGDSVLILPQGADSAGVVIPTGQVYFGNNTRAPEGSDSLFWDATNGRLGIGTNSPASNVHIYDSGNNYMRFEGAGDYTEFRQIATQLRITNNVASGNAGIDFNASPLNGSSSAFFRFFRETNTTGAAYFDVFEGDGSSGTNARIAGKGLNSFINAHHTDLHFGVGTSSPNATLHVDGDVRLENLSGGTPTQMVWADDDGKLRFVAPSTFDDYNGWNLKDGTPSTTLIGSGETVEFLAGSGLSVTRVGNTISYSASGSDEYVDGISFNTGSGVLTLTRAVGADLTYDLDGRYLVGNQTITLSGDVSGSGSTSITTNIASGVVGTTELANGSIAEIDLNVTNSPTDNYVLTANTGGGNFTWVDPATLGGSGDGNGFKDSGGTIAASATATTSGTGFTINVATSDVFDIDYNGTRKFRVDGTDVYVDDGMLVGGSSADYLRLGSTPGYAWAGHVDGGFGGNGIFFYDSPGEIEINGDTYIGDDADDQLLVQTTTSSVTMRHEVATNAYIQLQDDGDVVANASNTLFLVGVDDISTTGNIAINAANNATYALYVNGSQFSTSATTFTTSDRRVKEKINPIVDPYSKLLSLHPVTYEYREDYLLETNQERKIMKGFIAQDYESVFPEDVVEDNDRKAIDSQALTPYTVAAVQQLIKEVQELKQEIENLKQK